MCSNNFIKFAILMQELLTDLICCPPNAFELCDNSKGYKKSYLKFLYVGIDCEGIREVWTMSEAIQRY